jgi:sarcosine oxidase, subunit delta
VSYVLTCPNCGPREVTDFSFGGEVNPRPRTAPSPRELGAYNYFRDNVAGVQREWWFHRSGCGEWFLAERDTRTNQVLLTELPRSGSGHERPEACHERPEAERRHQGAGQDAPRRNDS